MVGVSEMYFIPFVLALGVGEVSAGLFFTIPYLCGSVLQLLAPWGVSFLKSPRKWVLCCAIVQCLSFIPLIDGAIRGSLPAWLFLHHLHSIGVRPLALALHGQRGLRHSSHRIFGQNILGGAVGSANS